MEGQERGWEVDPGRIKQFAAGEALECIIMEMATTPTVPPAQRTTYGSLLLSNIADIFTVWGDRGIKITKLYATSSTPTGIRILKNAGFEVSKDLGRGRLAFELDIEKSNAKIFKEYKEAVLEWGEKESAKQIKPRTTRGRAAPSNPAQAESDHRASSTI